MASMPYSLPCPGHAAWMMPWPMLRQMSGWLHAILPQRSNCREGWGNSRQKACFAQKKHEECQLTPTEIIPTSLQSYPKQAIRRLNRKKQVRFWINFCSMLFVRCKKCLHASLYCHIFHHNGNKTWV